MITYRGTGICMLMLVLILWGNTFSVPGILEDGSLDRETISSFYFEGEFDKVVESLEHFRKNNPNASDEDQVFVYKHLSVVYASNPDTKEKAESYMYQLLKLAPEEDLIDMYISAAIEDMFNKVKKRYQRLNPSPEKKAEVASGKKSQPQTSQSQKQQDSKQKDSKRWIYWTAGGTAVVAAVTVFILLSGDEEPSTTYRDLDPIELE